ncbi:MAG: hypothetical protein V7L00_24290 [Nostoc sp.]|uniref:hypothetical protein n=1 Tax=Nostoc sp. TaxID=1180 RepID=UPI002FF4B60C
MQISDFGLSTEGEGKATTSANDVIQTYSKAMRSRPNLSDEAAACANVVLSNAS